MIRRCGRRRYCVQSNGCLWSCAHTKHGTSDMMAEENEGIFVNEHEKQIVQDFCYLLDKSKQLFNGLRDLPQCGIKHWLQHFFRTFDVFTKLWKFQQQHRSLLNVCYGLKRWQIGEMASKIGQLYYHYYLRTSDTKYLQEAFAFYMAIRSRQYYCSVPADDKSDFLIKKLRYYARFILVCFLLRRLRLVRDLIKDMGRLVQEYSSHSASSHLEWSLVLTEIKAFLEADSAINVVDVDSRSVIFGHRISPYAVPNYDPPFGQTISLSEAVIVGNTCNQVKFGDFTLDMFWMLQTLEYERYEDPWNSQRFNSSPAPGNSPFDDSGNENPHKTFLYRPTFDQFMHVMSTTFQDLPPQGALLLYISGDGYFRDTPKVNEFYDFGGVPTVKTEDKQHPQAIGPAAAASAVVQAVAAGTGPASDHVRSIHCIYPGDLAPFLRKPFMLIVDSTNSTPFLSLTSVFGNPFVLLCSPTDLPKFLQEQPQRGSLFTLFLHCPLTAYCFICNVIKVPVVLWDKCQVHVDKFLNEALRLLLRSESADKCVKYFCGDDFFRMLLLRFIFCCCTLRLHRNFREKACYLPHSRPNFAGDDLVQQPSLVRLILDLACILDVMSVFRETEETVC